MHRSVGPIAFQCKPFTVCFPPGCFNSGFWAWGRLYTVSIGEKIKRSCSPSWKKSKLGVNWTAWAGAWDVMIRLLLASELLGLLCSHIDWTAPRTNWILKKPRDPSPTRPEAVYSGFREVSDKKGGAGGSRWGTEASLFTRIQGSCCCRYCCCSCLPVLQGGFLACQAFGGVAHRRLGDSSLPAAAADAQKVIPGRASRFQKLSGMDLFLICDFVHREGGLLKSQTTEFCLFFIRASPFLKEDLLYPLLLRAAVIFTCVVL